MRTADPSPRAFPPIRRLVVVALLAALALVAGRQLLAGGGQEAAPDPGRPVPVSVVGAADEHATSGATIGLLARRPVDHESLVAVPVPAVMASPSAAAVTWTSPPIVAPATDAGWASLGARAPPRRA